MAGLLGIRPSRHFKIFRVADPAIFRFNGQLYMENYDSELGTTEWVPIGPHQAERFLNPGRE